MAEQQSKEHDLDELPPSARFVLWVLEDEGEITQKELCEEITLPDRTIRWALKRLQDEGIVDSKPYTRDARQDIYSVAASPDDN